MKKTSLLRTAIICYALPYVTMQAQETSKFKEILSAVAQHAPRNFMLTRTPDVFNHQSIRNHLALLPQGLVTKIRGNDSTLEFESKVMTVTNALKNLIATKRKKAVKNDAPATMAEPQPAAMTNTYNGCYTDTDKLHKVIGSHPWPFIFLASLALPLPFLAVAIVGGIQLAQYDTEKEDAMAMAATGSTGATGATGAATGSTGVVMPSNIQNGGSMASTSNGPKQQKPKQSAQPKQSLQQKPSAQPKQSAPMIKPAPKKPANAKM